jgi:hypothetical protein
MAFSRIAYYTATSSAVALSTYMAIVYARTRQVPSSEIQVSLDVPDAFKKSYALSKLVNPNGHFSRPDTHQMTLRLPPRYAGLSDEVLLARVVKEFYSGWVFTPERWILRLLGQQFVGYADTASAPVPARIWHHSELSATKLPPLHSVLFGAWQVVDLKLVAEDSRDSQEESYIDLAYGKDQWPFAGCNRFSIRRDREAEAEAVANGRPTEVRVVYSQSNCNPLVDQDPMPDFMFKFHEVYAILLYKEVMSALKSWLQ